MPERVGDDSSKKTNREKALVLVSVIVLIGAGAIALLGVGLANWASTECEPGHCDGTKQIAFAIFSCIGLIPASAGVWAANKGDSVRLLGFSVATGAALLAWALALGLL